MLFLYETTVLKEIKHFRKNFADIELILQNQPKSAKTSTTTAIFTFG